MSVYEEIVKRFILEIEKTIAIMEMEYADGVYKIHIGKYIIYVYLPQNIRQERMGETPIIHLDIDQIIQDQVKIIKRINGIYGLGERIYARKTVVARVDKRVTIDFLTENHLQSAMPGKYRYGLFYNGELVSLAVFSGGRLMRDEVEGYRSFELIRFCHKMDVLVVGGLSKLIKAFVADFNPQDVVTYSDMDWAERSSLEKIGFEVIGHLEAQHYYVIGGKRSKNAPTDGVDFYKVMNKGSLKLKLIL